MRTTHTNRWRYTARCGASWANRTRQTSTLPRDKWPRRAASTDNIEHRTMPPRIRTYGPWLQPYGATSGHYARQCTHMTRRPNMTPRKLPGGGTPRAGNSGNGRRAKELAQEQQRYFQNPPPYKSLKHLGKVLGETGHRGIKAVCLQDGTVTNDPKVVLEEVLNSFQRQHNTEDEELSAYTKELISHLPKLYNQTQLRDMHRTPFTIRDFDEVLYKLQPGKTPGVDGLQAKLYRRLPLNLKRHLPVRLWDVAIGKTDVPPDRANLVHPLYKEGDWANPDNWRPPRKPNSYGRSSSNGWPRQCTRLYGPQYGKPYRVGRHWRPYLCKTPW